MPEISSESIQPLQEVFIVDPSDKRFEGEHSLSIQTATVLAGLDQLREHFDINYSTRMDDTEAQRIRVIVEDTYHSYLSENDRTDRDNYLDHTSFESPLEKKIDSVGNYLRNEWLESYYKPRTREATREDFQGWLDSYIDKYGENALLKTRRVDSDFLSIYRPFSSPIFKGRVSSDLRISTDDILLIPGSGAERIAVIENGISTVERALPEVRDHHTIYTLRTNPEAWSGQIKVPYDVIRPSYKSVSS